MTYNVYMIQITAYLRDEEDLKIWKAIGNKAAFIHDALQVQNSTLHGTMYPEGETKIPGGKVVVNETKIIKTPEEALKQVAAVGMKKVDIGMKFCKNGHPIPEGRTKCMGKGCKYA